MSSQSVGLASVGICLVLRSLSPFLLYYIIPHSGLPCKHKTGRCKCLSGSGATETILSAHMVGEFIDLYNIRSFDLLDYQLGNAITGLNLIVRNHQATQGDLDFPSIPGVDGAWCINYGDAMRKC